MQLSQFKLTVITLLLTAVTLNTRSKNDVWCAIVCPIKDPQQQHNSNNNTKLLQSQHNDK